ncbi:MAG: prolipoprotein diacylglyceryl transferase [Acidobacteriaceae bacterium]|nr:prolipoprotein diacylglyceryl transferase [Acidobacteriaceae bacterium]
MHPILFHFGRFVLPTFGVLAAAGLMLALSLSLRTAAMVRLDPEALWNAGLFAIVSALVSSRLLLVIANFKSFLSYPLLILALPSLTATGILLTLLATLVYLRFKRLPLLTTLDAWAPCATLVWAFLAFGHLAEGSDPGLISTLPWKILSPTGGAYLHPVALYAALAALLITEAALIALRRKAEAGRTVALALAASGVAQFCISFFRHPSFASDESPFFNVLDPIQWVSLGMVLAAGVIYIQTVPLALQSHAPEVPEHHAL